MAYDPEWWNRGRAGGQGGGRRGGTRQRDPIDVIERLAMWGMDLAQKGRQRADAKFNRFNKMAETLVGDIHWKLTSTQLDTKKEALKEYYEKIGAKDNLDITQVYDTYIQRIDDQKLENSNYEKEYKKWEEYSNRVDEVIDSSHHYAYLTSDDAKTTHRNEDSEFQKYIKEAAATTNTPVADLNTDAKYLEYIESEFSDNLDKFGDYKTTFFGEYNHRIPDNIINEMNDTEFFMTSLLNDWRDDDKIDHHEYEAYYNFIKGGDKEGLTKLREIKERGIKVQADAANSRLNVNISEYKAIAKHLNEGYKYIKEDEIAEIDKYKLDYELGTDDGLYKVQFDDRFMELPSTSDPNYNKLSKQKEIAKIFYNKYRNELQSIHNEIKSDDAILIDFGIEGSLKRYGFVPFTGGISAKKNAGINAVLSNTGADI